MDFTTKNKKDPRIINFQLKKKYFALDFYNHPDESAQIALSTYEKNQKNYISILKYNKHKILVKLALTEIDLPPTKIQFSPFRNEYSSNLLAVLTNKLSIYKYQNNSLKFYTDIFDKNNKNLPLICSDWNNNSKIIVGSLKEVFLFDIKKEKHINSVIIHNDLICDLSFNKNGNIFVSSGNEKKAFLTDLRNFNKSSMIFENKESLHKCKWNKGEKENLITFTSLSQKEILIFDIRKPEQTIGVLKYHKNFIHTINWFKNEKFLLSSDKNNCYVWDFQNYEKENFYPSSYRNFNSSIRNINISKFNDYVGIIQKQNFSLIKILY